MKLLILVLLFTLAYTEHIGDILNANPADVLSNLIEKDSKILNSKESSETSPLKAESTKLSKQSFKPSIPVEASIHGSGKLLKTNAVKAAAVVAPVKTIAVKKAAAAKLLAAPKLKVAPVAAVLKKKPKVHSLKPIIHVIEKPVPVYHKVPIPKKVLVPKFYPVYKKIPMPKIIPVPVKVPVKKIIPKVVKIPKAIPIPKIVPVKKQIPIAIPYPVPKFHKFPVPKPVPYAKYIPIPIPKKIPKFIPVPVKKVVKVPKPYYVPIKVPHFSASYIRTPMTVNVPKIKKIPHGGKFTGLKLPSLNLSKLDKGKFKALDSLSEGKNLNFGSSSAMSMEDKELLKMLTNVPGDKL